ncbi:MAG: 4'-phosphopantetheinyl transferase superfamily protein [Lachnospiraceae bacterium]|nr:4'-phosphopantetheinyl transferase superfamily protein [Lachnospiraceae bacterium]
MAVIYIYKNLISENPDYSSQHQAGVALSAYIRQSLGMSYTNISHSGRYVLIIGGDCRVGVDVELRGREVSPQAVLRSLSEGERDRCREGEFLRYWTLKEAYGKCMGVGLLYDYRGTDFLIEHGADELRRVEGRDKNYSYVNYFGPEIVFSACSENAGESFSVCQIIDGETDGEFALKPWPET